MLRRRLAPSIAALALVLTGCSATESETPQPAGPTAATASGVTVRLPAPERPLHGRKSERLGWRVSGYSPQAVVRPPYTNGLLLDGMLPAETDRDGVRAYERLGESYYHPVAIAQYALAQLDVARQEGDYEALAAAEVNADKLIEVAVRRDGAYYFPYPFDFPLGGNKKHTIQAPWWSAMAQGEALSLFVRLYEVTDEEKWREAADRTFASLDDDFGPRRGPWTLYVDKHGYLWFEEYAGDTAPLLVLNGHMFAVFGIWDYHRLTEEPRARQLFDGGVTLLREYLPLFRADGEPSYYCLRAPWCQRDRWKDEKYHLIVSEQMKIIADMTDDRWFRREARRFLADYSG